MFLSAPVGVYTSRITAFELSAPLESSEPSKPTKRVLYDQTVTNKRVVTRGKDERPPPLPLEVVHDEVV